MSAKFQGLVDDQGEVNLDILATPVRPAGTIDFRGMAVSSLGRILALQDTGQARVFQDGLAIDASTGALLINTNAIANITNGALAVDAAGSVVVLSDFPDVIHQGVGLDNAGRLSYISANLWSNQPEILQAGWTDNGDGTFTSDGTASNQIRDEVAPGILINGETYRVWFDVLARTAGAVRVVIYGDNQAGIGAERSVVGSYYEEVTITDPTSNQNTLAFQSRNNFNGTIGNIYITPKG